MNIVPDYVTHRLNEITELLNNLSKKNNELAHDFEKVLLIDNLHERGLKIVHEIMPLMLEVRHIIDAYEKISSVDVYDIPLYGEILFGNR
ncbi:hypothetical protein SDC9_104917 [bioreactor metagenome]|uniref:Uncharacterized protein n=1 Tax=bioreactor metagenome TaxID=1076179 RepID=A0A645AZ75_9ZZZZ